MMKPKNITLVLIFMFSATLITYGQTSSTCDEIFHSSKGTQSVEFFLTIVGDINLEEFRAEIGIFNESIERINEVNDGDVCLHLQEIINGDEVLNGIENNLSEDRGKYYYETENFYYLFWRRKPEFDNIPRTGPKTIFVVIKDDLSEYWKYYF